MFLCMTDGFDLMTGILDGHMTDAVRKQSRRGARRDADVDAMMMMMMATRRAENNDTIIHRKWYIQSRARLVSLLRIGDVLSG